MKVSLHSSAAFYGLSGTFNNISVLLGGKQVQEKNHHFLASS
jgi:hypothetical protein